MNFQKTCKAVYNDMTQRYKYQSKYSVTSKALSKFLRRSDLLYLFNTGGTVNIGSLFNELGENNPNQNQMSPRDFAALLLCNDKQRFQITVFVNGTWKPFGIPPTQPWDLRIGAVQGRSNKTVDPYALHHPLTKESNCLGWIFDVTSADNRRSIEQNGLLMNPYGGKGYGRDSVHFMYHNDNSRGYIRMAEGTVVPRSYRNPIYCVLVPQAAFEFQLFLSKNGVILAYNDIPPHLLKIVEQMPTIACPVMQAGRGHTLSPTVTGGVWPDNITYDRMKTEKGVGFVPGGEIPARVRSTAWDFMGQEIPRNYGMLVFSQPLSRPDEFDPSSESVYGLLQGGSRQRGEPTNDDDEPMRDPYTQRRGGSHQREELHGSSPEEALHKERHLNKTHQPSAGGKNIDRHQNPQMDKVNIEKQMQLLTLKSHTSKRKTK